MKQTKLFFAFALFAMLAGSGLRAQTYYINENFNALPQGSTLPTGWVNNIIAGNSSYDFWRFGQSGVSHAVGNPYFAPRTASSPIAGIFALFDSDATSSGGGSENVALETPAFNTTGKSEIKVKWDQKFDANYGGVVYVEVFNGTSWMQAYTSNTSATNTTDIDISAHAANKTNAKVRFRWTGAYSMYWIVDNIQVYAPPPSVLFLTQNFDATSSGSTPPSGWTNNRITGSSTVDFWRFGQPGITHSVGNPFPRNPAAPIATRFALFDSDKTSNNSTAENVALESPVMNTTGFTSNIRLKWDQHFQSGAGGAAFVEVFNGSSWVQVYTTTSQAVNSQNIDITSHVANKTNARVRFRWTGNWSWYWIVDNIRVEAPAPIPNANFTINNATQCKTGNNFVFTNTSTVSPGTLTYLWEFGDGTTSTATSPSKTYANPGTYNVKLTATGNYGGVATITKTATVNAMTPSAVAISNNMGSNAICTGTSVTFTATPSGGGASPTYQWWKNNTMVGTGATYNAGTGLVNNDAISVRMTSNAVCPTQQPAVKAVVMTVASSLTPSVTIAANTGANTCVGKSVTFTATPTHGGTAPTYQWFKNNVQVGTGVSYNAGTSLVTGDQVRARMTSNIGCPTSGNLIANSATTTMTVNALTTAAVSINVTPSSTGCQNQTFTFTATPTGGGSTPSYQWKRDGNPIGSNSPVYNPPSNSLNGNIYTCEMTSSLQCPSITPAVSNAIQMTVHPVVTPKVVISASPAAAPYCFGSPVIFTAAPTGGGTAPTYQWKLDGVNTVTTTTYTVPTNLAPGAHTVSCTMTTNYVCPSSATATATYNFTISPIVTPSISIASSQVASNGDMCQSTNVTYTATVANQGANPVYQWYKNNAPVGTSSTSYNAGTGLVTGDDIKCVMTSNANCQSTNFTQSNVSTVNVWSNVTNTVSIVSDAPNNSWCGGLPVTFTATAPNGGTNPVYQWRKGSTNVGSDSPVYVDAALNNNDQISCRVTTSRPCATPTLATSNTITMTINPVISTTIEITVNPDTVGCEGDPFLFAASFTNGGTTPQLQWYANGVAVPGAKQLTFSSNTLQNGDQISCELASSMTCAFPEMSNVKTVALTPSPVPAVTIGGYPSEQGVTFYSTVTNGGTGVKYQWVNNGNTIDGATSATYSASDLKETDKISLLIESSLACAKPKSVMSASMEVFRVTDVKNVQATFKELNLFPNPNDGRFTIQGELQEAGADKAHVEVLNAIGQVVFKADEQLNGKELKLGVDLGGRAAAGMYMVRISIGDRTETMRFVLN